jgi:hypothetical protein
MPKLTYAQLFERRIEDKNPDLREFLEKAEELRLSLSPSYDRDEGMVIPMRTLLRGAKTLKGADSGSLTRVADLASRCACGHKHAAQLEQVAREMVAYHHSRIRT